MVSYQSQQHLCQRGLNLMRSVELLRTLPTHLQDVIRPVVQRNAYWAHPEAVLLAMVAALTPQCVPGP